ncbi:MAG TPA: dipeptide epimerase [Verrucomicrobiota bacterium]|nr:dipeptide epimerase [Verrucomicrobiota bacterium]HNU51974.1 dipeptide epimerase [Verrucomicrobiota bacterium]
MKLRFWRYDLRLAHRWTIARGLEPGGEGGADIFKVVFVELTDKDGTVGLGEAAPSSRYGETVDADMAFFEHVNPYQISFNDVAGSMKYIAGIAPGSHAAKGALNIALVDGAARLAGKRVCDHLGLGFRENHHVTSFSIGIDTPEKMRQKVLEAEPYPVLKLKVGSPDDRANLGALREVAPKKPVRVDANEAWKTKEEALRQIEWLASDGHIQFVEQPMPARSDPRDMAWLKARSPLPLMGDESYIYAREIEACAPCFHSVNVKLVKAGGITAAHEALRAARQAGLKTMLGCMIESSVLITAAAHLAELTDYLDIDGNLLITNDPYRGATARKGVISLADAPGKTGLGVESRPATGL